MTQVPKMKLFNFQLRHCDVRYALFYATTNGATVVITHLFLAAGEAFFSCFPPFGGKVLNKKLQIPHDLLPARKAADPGFLARSITIQTWTYAMTFSESHSNGPATGG